jgi:hypothetical protein
MQVIEVGPRSQFARMDEEMKVYQSVHLRSLSTAPILAHHRNDAVFKRHRKVFRVRQVLDYNVKDTN